MNLNFRNTAITQILRPISHQWKPDRGIVAIWDKAGAVRGRRVILYPTRPVLVATQARNARSGVWIFGRPVATHQARHSASRA